MKYIKDDFLNTNLEILSEQFNQIGFIKLNRIFSDNFIEYIQQQINESINAPIDKYQTGFSRIAFDLFVNDYIILGLISDKYFRKIITEITKRELFYTQGLAFELEKNRSAGFPWHIGTQSFGYQY